MKHIIASIGISSHRRLLGEISETLGLKPGPNSTSAFHVPTFDAADVDRAEIASLNLLCAQGLPGADRLDMEACLRTLDAWTQSARCFVRDSRPQFERNPNEYDCQEGFFCFLSMVTLLKHPRGLGISYQPRAIGSYDFSDSRDDLLHGLLTRRLGTCTSLPVLFVAIGRRLGWPMHLAVAKRHVFCQWINRDGSHLNLEGSCPGGGQMHSDQYYHCWPGVLTREDLASGRYLRPLSKLECLALFLETRGHCLVDNRRYEEAEAAYAAAKRLAPKWSQYEDHVYAMELHRSGRRRANGDRLPPRASQATIAPNYRLFDTVTELSDARDFRIEGS